MSSLVANQIDYFATEAELAELFAKTGLPREFSNKFIKDYAALKRNSTDAAQVVDENSGSIEVLTARVADVETDISALTIRVNNNETAITAIELRVTTAEGEISTLRIDLDQLRLEFDDHIAETEAHGATGDIVGTDDYAQPAIGGTVFLAAAVANAAASAVSVTSPDATAAPAVYDQTQAQSVVTLANEMKGDINTLVANLNAVVTQLNALLASERAAKQLAL